jgi:hypothetical protein
MSQSDRFKIVGVSIFIALGFSFIIKVANWILRIRAFRKTMPVIPALFPPDSHYRRLWPKQWQTFHQDWHMQYKRKIYHELNSDIFVLCCLFEYDKVQVTDPAAVVDVKSTQPKEFPKDMQIFSKVYSA